MTDYEFEVILEEIHKELAAHEGPDKVPEIVVYEKQSYIPMGTMYQCGMSPDGSQVLVNRDLVLSHYPYADSDTIRQILSEEIKELRRYSHAGK